MFHANLHLSADSAPLRAKNDDVGPASVRSYSCGLLPFPDSGMGTFKQEW